MLCLTSNYKIIIVQRLNLYDILSGYNYELSCFTDQKESLIKHENDINHTTRGVTIMVSIFIILMVLFGSAYIQNRKIKYRTSDEVIRVKNRMHMSKEKAITIVDNFVFYGITILSDRLNPAVRDASLKVLKFSTEEFNKDKDVFDKLRESLKINNSAIEESNKGSFLMQNNNKEENMEEEIKNAVEQQEEVILNSAEESSQQVENACGDKVKNADEDVDNACGNKMDNACGDKPVENACGNKVDNACGDKVKNEEEDVDNACGKVKNAEGESDSEESTEDVENAIKVKCSELEAKNSELEIKCSEYEATVNGLQEKIKELEVKCSTLEEFKTNTENAQRVQEIECALEEVSSILTVEEIAQWREKSVNCSTVDGFKNELKAFAFDVQKERGIQQATETLRNSITIPNSKEEESLDVWDRLAKSL